jgi:hypothetical protein
MAPQTAQTAQFEDWSNPKPQFEDWSTGALEIHHQSLGKKNSHSLKFFPFFPLPASKVAILALTT